MTLTRRGRVLGLTAVCASAFALGSWNWLWEQMPWAV
jgi:hypothetical protein